ncbi:MAG: hypothetical protein ACK5IA_03130, partial [Cyanobacteriota bacterium]
MPLRPEPRLLPARRLLIGLGTAVLVGIGGLAMRPLLNAGPADAQPAAGAVAGSVAVLKEPPPLVPLPPAPELARSEDGRHYPL